MTHRIAERVPSQAREDGRIPVVAPARRLHPYAATALGAALIALGLNVAMAIPYQARSWTLFVGLAGYLLAYTVLLAMAGIGLGLHTLVRRRWPGRTATERKRRPTRRDVGVALLAIAITVVDLLAALGWWSLV